MFLNCKNSKQQGTVGLAEAILHFTKVGATVSLPLNDSQDYDLVVDHSSILSRVEVKTTKNVTPSGAFEVDLRNKGGTAGSIYARVGEGSSDLLFVLCENGNKYLLPKTVYASLKSSITLGIKYKEYLV